MTLFQRGPATLHSGGVSDWKIECDALAGEDLATIADLIVDRVPPFREVESIPTGGNRLRAALFRHRTLSADATLVVDDVWTTGRSMLEALAGRPYMYGAVIFARGPIYDGRVTALFTADIAEVLRPLHEARSDRRLRNTDDAERYRRAVSEAVADLDRWALCHDCAVPPGVPHDDGCDTARCTVCGWQRISCEHEGADVGWGEVWTGQWPGRLEVSEGLADDLNDLADRSMQGLLKWDGWRWR